MGCTLEQKCRRIKSLSVHEDSGRLELPTNSAESPQLSAPHQIQLFHNR
jgi:hypothetical protein